MVKPLRCGEGGLLWVYEAGRTVLFFFLDGTQLPAPSFSPWRQVSRIVTYCYADLADCCNSKFNHPLEPRFVALISLPMRSIAQ